MMALGFLRKDADHGLALDRIAAQTRKRFRLGDQAVVLVAELACSLPGCPPLDTVVVFWTPQGVRHRFKIFKPARQVTEEDLPYDWLMRSLAAPEGFDEDCC
jgi:hypothetical protein